MAIMSMSVGRASAHSMESKVDAMAVNGFEGIEIFYEDLEAIAEKYPGGLTDDNRIEAARVIRKLCDERNIEVIGLQPFIFYEGLMDSKVHASHIQKLKLWFHLVKILGTDLILVPSNFLQTGITGDKATISSDLIEIADLGLQERPVVRFAYEALAWGKFADTWQDAWEVVQNVNKANFGMALDTFQVAGRVWADPASPTGKNVDADRLLKESLDELVATVDLAKIFYIQVGDAEKPETPVVPGHNWYTEGQPSRMGWGRNARLFANDSTGGYLPVVQCAETFIHHLGYKGWVSCKIFSRHLENADPSIPAQFAARAAQGFRKLMIEELKLAI